MSGDHPELIRCCSSMVSPPLAAPFKEVLHSILGNQFVRLPEEDPPVRAWQVLKGAGMGMICGGEIADATFLTLVEKNFLILPETWAVFSIKFYARFKDDCLLILGGTPSTRAKLLQDLRS